MRKETPLPTKNNSPIPKGNGEELLEMIPLEGFRPNSETSGKDYFHAESRGARRDFLKTTERHGVSPRQSQAFH
jgi:hypothetical protein